MLELIQMPGINADHSTAGNTISTLLQPCWPLQDCLASTASNAVHSIFINHLSQGALLGTAWLPHNSVHSG